MKFWLHLNCNMQWCTYPRWKHAKGVVENIQCSHIFHLQINGTCNSGVTEIWSLRNIIGVVIFYRKLSPSITFLVSPWAHGKSMQRSYINCKFTKYLKYTGSYKLFTNQHAISPSAMFFIDEWIPIPNSFQCQLQRFLLCMCANLEFQFLNLV